MRLSRTQQVDERPCVLVREPGPGPTRERIVRSIPGHDVEVEVEHDLARQRTLVRGHVVMRGEPVDFSANLGYGMKETRVCLFRKVGQSVHVPPGHDEHVSPGYRKQVEESDSIRVLVDCPRRRPTFNDVTENAVSRITVVASHPAANPGARITVSGPGRQGIVSRRRIAVRWGRRRVGRSSRVTRWAGQPAVESPRLLVVQRGPPEPLRTFRPCQS